MQLITRCMLPYRIGSREVVAMALLKIHSPLPDRNRIMPIEARKYVSQSPLGIS
jgi:hypothetical protein